MRDDLRHFRRDAFDLGLPWGWILCAILALCFVLDRLQVWAVK